MHSEEQHPTLKHRTLSKRGTPPFFQSGINLVLGNALVHPFEKNPALVVTAKLIWLFFLNILSFNLIQTSNKSLRFRKFRRNNVHHSLVVQTDHCQVALLFLLDVRCPKFPHSFFCDCLPTKIVDLRILFLLSTPVVQMLLTPRCVSRRKHVR